MYLGWHAWPPQRVPAETEEEPVPDAALDDDVLREALSDADTLQSESDEQAGWWRPYLISEEFLAACLQLIRRVLHHSRIRRFTLEGTLGLPQPHQTGMTAGFLYMVAPRQAATLQFNFLEEIYDCEAVLAGTIYPGALILYAAAFMTTRPLRKLLRAILQRRRDTDHGQKRTKKQPGNDI